MQGDDYRHVQEYCDSFKKAEGLGLLLTPDTSTRSIKVTQVVVDGAAFAYVKIESLSVWLTGFEVARKLYRDDTAKAAP